MNIVLNGKPITITSRTLTYTDIVELAGMTGYPTVAYKMKPKGDVQRSGTLHCDSPALEVEEGMAINAVHTGFA